MKNIKKIVAVMLTAVMMLAMSAVVFAENTDDNGHLSIAADQQFDVCMHNTWANKDCGCFYANIDNVRVKMTVSGFAGDPITTQLIMRESKTWNHWTSEAVEIAGDGTYEYYIDMADNFVEDAETGEMVGGSFLTEELLVLYVKDVKVCSAEETPLGEAAEVSGVACDVQIDSLVFNAGDVTEEPAPEEEVVEAVEEITDDADGVDTSAATEEVAEPTAEDTDSAPATETVAPAAKKGLPTPVIVVVCVAVVVCVIVVVTKRKK